MPRIKKDRPKLHIVVFDTSVLWCDDKRHAVNPAVTDMCRECAELLDMELVIPSTVYGELHFQQTTSAARALDRANQAFAEISTISNSPYTHKVTSAKLRANVKAKLDKWIADNNARVAKISTKAIDWDRLVKKAIWREPPFTFDPKDKINEKGFRDALILETLIGLSKTDKRDALIVFLSADTLLRTAAQASLRSDSRCLFFDSLDGFKSYVKLTGEELTQKFISKILARASEKFYRKDDDTCLYRREGILSKLQSKYAEYFANPQKAEATLSLSASKWQVANQPKIWIDNTRFASIEPKSAYHWATQLTYLCLYKSEAAGFKFDLFQEAGEKLLLLAFLATWKAFVKADGRFHEVTLTGLDLLVSSFAEPTADQRKKYGLTSGET